MVSGTNINTGFNMNSITTKPSNFENSKHQKFASSNINFYGGPQLALSSSTSMNKIPRG